MDQLIDVMSAGKLSQLYPDRVLLVKYEELVTSPARAVSTILQFLGLPWHQTVWKFMEDHMTHKVKI